MAANSSTYWAPFGKLINLSELPFDLINGAAVSIHKMMYVKCLACSRCYMSGDTGQQAFTWQRGLVRNLVDVREV